MLHLCAYLMENRLPHLEQDSRKRKASTGDMLKSPVDEQSAPTAPQALKEFARTKAKFHHQMLHHLEDMGTFKTSTT